MNQLKKIGVILGLLVSSYSYSSDFGKCNTMFPNSRPPEVAQKNVRELCFREFAVLYSVDSKTPVYVVERLNYLRFLGQKFKRSNHFHEEPMLRLSERSTLDDYKNSGYDRGHNCPAADVSNDPVAMEESFSLSNMAPQAQKLNRNCWAKNVEKPTRQYVAKRAKGDVFVFTGPYFGPNPKTIGPHRVWVPDYFFKLVYDQAANRAWVYWLPNSDDAVMTKPISYEEFVAKTGLRLLPN